MVSFEKFKDYLLRAELHRASFLPVFNGNYSHYYNGDVTVDYQNGRLAKIEVAGKDLSDYFPLLIPEDECESLYDFITDDAIQFVYDHLVHRYGY